MKDNSDELNPLEHEGFDGLGAWRGINNNKDGWSLIKAFNKRLVFHLEATDPAKQLLSICPERGFLGFMSIAQARDVYANIYFWSTEHESGSGFQYWLEASGRRVCRRVLNDPGLEHGDVYWHKNKKDPPDFCIFRGKTDRHPDATPDSIDFDCLRSFSEDLYRDEAMPRDPSGHFTLSRTISCSNMDGLDAKTNENPEQGWYVKNALIIGEKQFHRVLERRLPFRREGGDRRRFIEDDTRPHRRRQRNSASIPERRGNSYSKHPPSGRRIAKYDRRAVARKAFFPHETDKDWDYPPILDNCREQRMYRELAKVSTKKAERFAYLFNCYQGGDGPYPWTSGNQTELDNFYEEDSPSEGVEELEGRASHEFKRVWGTLSEETKELDWTKYLDLVKQRDALYEKENPPPESDLDENLFS